MRIVFRQWLLAKDVLAGGDQREACRVVDAVRRYICGCIEFAPGDRLVERAEAFFDVEMIGELIEPAPIRIDGADHLDTVDGEEVGNLVFGHRARTKNE